MARQNTSLTRDKGAAGSDAVSAAGLRPIGGKHAFDWPLNLVRLYTSSTRTLSSSSR
jgi:hypothetical protein